MRQLHGPPSDDVLREVTADTVGAVCSLQVASDQRHLVAENAYSIAQAYFQPHAWFRGIYDGQTPVGFLMVYDDPAQPSLYLWRFMVAEPFQGRGHARRAMDALIGYARTRPGTKSLTLSVVKDDSRSAEKLYERLGFVRTGTEHGIEADMRLDLA